MYKGGIKRMIDCVIAFAVLVIGFLPMCLVALLIRLESPGPAIFRQQRIGKDGRGVNC